LSNHQTIPPVTMSVNAAPATSEAAGSRTLHHEVDPLRNSCQREGPTCRRSPSGSRLASPGWQDGRPDDRFCSAASPATDQEGLGG
jgi:hypothetical protein